MTLASPVHDPVDLASALAGVLDRLGLGDGPVELSPIGEGHSNVTLLTVRGTVEVVLRLPPSGPLAPKTHDIVREARLLAALAGTAVPCPRILHIEPDPAVLGRPFSLMSKIEGDPVGATIHPSLDEPEERRGVANAAVDALVAIHAVDWRANAGLVRLAPPDGYLGRQVSRFTALLHANATRPLPALDAVAKWLAQHIPDTSTTCLVHGDFRLGNLLFARAAPARVDAVVDWEMATLGDPLADLGYFLACYAEAGDDSDPMFVLSDVTRRPGFPSRAELAARYAECSGRPVDELDFYVVLAVWKAAIFLEGSFGRYQAGTTSDPFFATLETGVPSLAERALRLARKADPSNDCAIDRPCGSVASRVREEKGSK
jgi:aminoglycoside phosphotransferase (APT) family kinase protein